MTALRWLACSGTWLFLACSAPAPSVVSRVSQAPAAAPAEREDDSEGADSPKDTVARADQIYRDQLAVQGRDERFSTDRQVTELRRAIALYRQFIERAGTDPAFSEAVRRSRDRIEDAEATIAFLLGERAE